jgi:molybdate/tungstate transport system substrate-binding protein
VKQIVRHVCMWLMLIFIISVSGCGTAEDKKTEIFILNAGSLVIPMEQLEKEFEELNPDIDVKYEGHGSIQVVRHITEIGDLADIAMVADYSLLPLLMYPAEMPDGGAFADWHIQFATNQLGIAFTPESKYADEITADNWYEILRRADVNLGFSDPRLDAVGYRSLMLLQLAEEYYGDKEIFNDLVTSNFNATVRSSEYNYNYTITVPELLESTNDRIYLRGFSVQLLALLESNQIDYAFEYESVALQHGLNFIDLPAEIDLSQEKLTEYYDKVTVKLDYQRYKTVMPIFEGLPIIYGITIPYSAPHPEEAIRFIEFILGENGQKILRDNYQPPIDPVRSDNIQKVPEKLRDYIE